MSILCRLGMHNKCRPKSDDHGCWGEIVPIDPELVSMKSLNMIQKDITHKMLK